MSAEENKAVAMRIIDAINKKDLQTVDELLAPSFVEHNPPSGMPQTREKTKQVIGMVVQAFPDFHYDVTVMIAEGDKVTQHLTVHGSMNGEFLWKKPTSKSATWTETHIGRIVNGKFTDHWICQDQVGMMQQLGLMPRPK